MDRRSWPWRKKSVEKIGRLQNSADSSLAFSSKRSDGQVIAKVPQAEQARTANEGLSQCQTLEKKIKPPSEKLSALLFDVRANDGLVKQPAKAANEAVSGWEMAEAAALKMQLDTAIQQKEATEDRVSHLDGALKESTRQLRLAREEQEEKIHAAIMQKSREWKRVHSEVEEQLADVNAKLLETSAENEAMSKLLQERATNISEISDSLTQARGEVNLLQMQLDDMQKENASLRFERTVLSKELEVRNQESVLNKRSSEVAINRHLEDGKRIARLDAECQRLRNLVRKKLPGRSTLAQMKLEAATSTKDKGETVGGKRILKGCKSDKEELSPARVDSSSIGKALDVQTVCLSSMEEETRKLKNLLGEKDNELQYARLICARSASKLSSSGDQQKASGFLNMTGMTPLDVHLQAERMSLISSCEPSLVSRSDDGHDDEASCAESWASALITELAQFKKEKDDVLASRVAVMGQTKQVDVRYWEERVELLEKEILEEHNKNMRLESKCRELEEHLLKLAVPLGGSQSSCFHCGAGKGDANGDSKVDLEPASKDQEMAASADKLAECQRTMLRLSERMKTLNFSEETPKSPGEALSQRVSMRNAAGARSRLSRANEGGPDPRRDSNASDMMLETEIASLSGSLRPMLVDSSGERPPLHDHEYAQAVQDMSSSSSEPLADDGADADEPTNSPPWVASPGQAFDSGSSSSSSSSSSSKTPLPEWKASRISKPADATARRGSFTRLFFSRGKNGQ